MNLESLLKWIDRNVDYDYYYNDQWNDPLKMLRRSAFNCRDGKVEKERDILIPGSIRCGKQLVTELKWKNLQCENHCDGELYIKDTNEYEELKICPVCGKKYLLIRKLRK